MESDKNENLTPRENAPAYPIGYGMNLHLGCGEIDFPGFVNIDARKYDHVHHVSLVDSLPFIDDSTADLVYASHCLEHFPHGKIEAVLREWHRVLKPCGIIRLSVPDFDSILKIYLDNDRDMSLIVPPLYGGQDYEYNYHYVAFNHNSLKQILENVGFTNVRLWSHGQDEFSSMPDWSGKTVRLNSKDYFLSLNIEGQKKTPVKFGKSGSLPRITIITPSYNQGEFIEQTILSIIGQEYPNLQYIVIDGGSTDATVSILEKYSDRISYWVSEKDRGQSHAINKGVAVADGDIFNWVNSDDWLAPGALHAIAQAFSNTGAKLICSPTRLVHSDGRETIGGATAHSESIEDILNIRGLNQMGMYWAMDRVKALGGVNDAFTYSMDLDLWKRYVLTYGTGQIAHIDTPTGYFRLHEASKTGVDFDTSKPLFDRENNAAFWNYAAAAGPKYLKGMQLLYPDVQPKVVNANLPNAFDKEVLQRWLTALYFEKGKRAFYRNDFKFCYSILGCLDDTWLTANDSKDCRSFKRWSSLKRWF
jgi:glycosyltransferase involved in cell wall biosynthesis/predicted SAM-dependent methyltransferase